MFTLLTNGQGWGHPIYSKYRKEEERDEDNETRQENTISEGALTCKCGNKRIIIKTLQVRSSDEGTTVFAKCTKCNRKWKEG